MARRYDALQRKLEELASQFNDIIFKPLDETTHLQLHSEDFNRKLAFMKKILSAEIQSQPHKTQNLHQLAQKLEVLESVFKDWDTIRTSSDTVSMRSYKESLMNDDKVLSEGGGDDADSTSSFSESCPNEVSIEYGGGGSPGHDHELHKDPRTSFQSGVVQEQQKVKTVVAEGYVKKKKNEERRHLLSRDKVSAVISVVMILTVAIVSVVMAGFCCFCCCRSEVECFPPPT